MVREREVGTVRQMNGGSVNTRAVLRDTFVQVTELFCESCSSNTGKMIGERFLCGLKGRLWSLNFILTQLGTILCFCLDK